MDNATRYHEIYNRLKTASVNWRQTSMTPYEGQPFKALIAAMLSAATREEATTAASEALFAFADTPQKVLDADKERVMNAIHPATYHRNKTKYTLGICRKLIDEHGGEVPNDLDALMDLPGVGYKVGTLVQYIAFGDAEHIVVDTHVDRISKRLGIIEPDIKGTKKVGQALEAALPRDLWAEWNALMVMFGRNVCYARSPQCGTCLLRDVCPRVGVD